MTPSQNSAPSVGRPFTKGTSGNPGGRPKGLVATVQSKAGKDGAKLVEALMAIALGTAAARKKVFWEEVKVNAKDRREAIRELLDRGWGRPVQAIAGPDGGPIPVTSIVEVIVDGASSPD